MGLTLSALHLDIRYIRCTQVSLQTNWGFNFLYHKQLLTYDAYSWYSNVSAFPALDSQIAHGPVFAYEYSTREEYGTNITWPENAPLNATWWHRVTEQMELNPSLVQASRFLCVSFEANASWLFGIGIELGRFRSCVDIYRPSRKTKHQVSPLHHWRVCRSKDRW